MRHLQKPGHFGQIVQIVHQKHLPYYLPEQDEETGLRPTFNWNASNDSDLYDEITYTLSYGTNPSDLTDITSQESFENNYSLSFDGVDDYVAVDNFKLNQPQTLTIGLSIKIDRTDGYLDTHTNILENDRSGGQFAIGYDQNEQARIFQVKVGSNFIRYLLQLLLKNG